MDLEGLSMICAGLGSTEEDDEGNKVGYTKSQHCLENLKDLMRFLRRDDPQTREVFMQVSKWNIVAKDLIPIIENYHDDYNLVLNVVKILVFLTIPIDPTSNEIPQQIEYLWQLKSSITTSHIVPVTISILENPLHNLESGAFTEEDWKLVQLVLTLFRNLLAIQHITLQQKLGGSASQIVSLRDRFLKLLFDENVMDLIIVLAQHVEGSKGLLRQDNLLILETFHYIFMGQDPEMVAKAYKICSQADPSANYILDSLKFTLHDEKKQSISRLRTFGRHSQFTGTFTRYTMDGSKSLRTGTPVPTSHVSQSKPNKNKAIRGSSKRPAWDPSILPSTEHGILRSLHDFVKQFLKGGYNVLMESIREDIEKEHHAIENSDVAVFFGVAQFITSFQYHNLLSTKIEEESKICDGSTDTDGDSTLFDGNICGPIASSMNESMFLLVISKWRQAFEGLKETKNYKFLSAAGSVMKTLIHMLDMVFKLSPDGSRESHTARILLYKLFYDQTDQGMTQFVLCLMKSFDVCKQPKSDLSDLVEMLHVIVRVLEKLQADGTLRVSRKTRKGRPKIHQKNEKADDRLNVEDGVGRDMNVLNNDQSAEVNHSNKEQMNEGQMKEGEKSVVESPASEKINCESELPHVDPKHDHANSDCHLGEHSNSSSEEEQVSTTEVDFKISTLVSGFANENIIRNLCWLLSFYKNNSVKINYYIVCMLRRICEDLELSPMLYQLSFLMIFYKILAEQKSCPCKDHENIVQFLTTLIRRMLRKMKSQPLLFVEILYWKTRRECNYISCNSMLHELSKFRDGTNNCGSASGNEQFGLQGLRRSIADALGDDEADFVMPHDSNRVDETGNDARSNSATEVGREETADSGIRATYLETGKLSKRKKRLVLNSEMEDRIKNLYERYKDDPHCTELIANALDSDGNISQAQVSTKLKKLGFSVRSKKRSRKISDHTDSKMEGAVKESDPSSNINHEGESLTLRRELPTRKRVRAFSKDQEEKIKTLYEQFKGQRRCSYMIASALDNNGTFTASQVSRKLKQLGLFTSTVHKLGKGRQIVEPCSDYGSDDEPFSDAETLQSFRNRNRKKIKQVVNDEPILENASAELLDGSSNDESVMDGSEHSLIGSPDSTKSVPNSVVKGAEDNITGVMNEELLEDSEDDATPVGLPENDGAGPWRRKRMVVEFEEDD
uniref:Timeless N-terminal domain-containing protein n=1 Tax=Kalanchoe fedtschenkoi TaxID=63787 RepID=A0A7N0TEM8_KALFE